MPTKRKFRVCLTTVITCGMVVFIGLWLRSGSKIRQPVYQGKPYSQWVQEINSLGSGLEVESRQEPARAAIEAMGTNIIPFLLQEIACKDDSIVTYSIMKNVPGWLHANQRRDYASIGFRVLREHTNLFIGRLRELSNANSTVPTLLESLDRRY